MAKKKTSKIEKGKKEKLFFYEILGIIIIILSMLAITRLGLVGNYLMLTFRLLFGDWYFIFIGILFLYGIYCLIVHKALDFRNIRYLGIICISLSLLILSHFAMHQYVISYEENHYVLTLNLYLDYFKHSQASSMVGGGIIGGSLFYLCFYLFSYSGTIIMAILLLFIGIVFICRKTIKEFILGIWNFIVKIGNKFKLFYLKLKENLQIINSNYKHEDKKVKKKLSKRILQKTNLKELEDEERQYCLGVEVSIKETFNKLGIIYSDVSFIMCPHLDAFFIKIFYDINYNNLYYELRKVINQKLLIRINPDENQIIIEVNRVNPYHLTFYQVLKEQKDFIFGMDDRNNYLKVDQNLLLIGKNNNIMNNYFISLVLFPKFCYKTKKDEVYLFDLTKKMEEFSKYVDYYFETYLELGGLISSIEERMDLLNDGHYANIEKYNLHHLGEELNNKYVYIFGVEKLIEHKQALEKLEYLLRVSVNTGFYFIIALLENKEISTNMLSLFEYKILFENYYLSTRELMDDPYFDILNSKYEGFMKWRDILLRMSYLHLSKEEIRRIGLTIDEKKD